MNLLLQQSFEVYVNFPIFISKFFNFFINKLKLYFKVKNLTKIAHQY